MADARPSRILFIGGGNMASAMIGGLLRAATAATGRPLEVSVIEPDPTTRASLESRFGIATHDAPGPAIGADAIVLSNHGGRQLDSAASTISVLPEIADRTRGELELLIDSGFRRGSDILKALALGASGVLLGRAYAFALAAEGEAGVAKMLTILESEMTINLALMGLGSISELQAKGVKALRAGSWDYSARRSSSE